MEMTAIVAVETVATAEMAATAETAAMAEMAVATMAMTAAVDNRDSRCKGTSIHGYTLGTG
jgi:hypothetical protein